MAPPATEARRLDAARASAAAVLAAPQLSSVVNAIKCLQPLIQDSSAAVVKQCMMSLHVVLRVGLALFSAKVSAAIDFFACSGILAQALHLQQPSLLRTNVLQDTKGGLGQQWDRDPETT